MIWVNDTYNFLNSSTGYLTIAAFKYMKNNYLNKCKWFKMFFSPILASLNSKTVKTLKVSTSLLIYMFEFYEITKLTNKLYSTGT